MIKIEHVYKTFKAQGKQVEALKDVSLSIDEGDIFGVIGYSGAGKSTLIRMINLLEKPDKGYIEVNGQDLMYLKRKELCKLRSNIGMIFQGFNLMNTINVYENIASPLKNLGWKKKEIEEKVNSLLELVGLTDKKYAYPSQLSGGQKQRVAIARALSSDPKILLCDEATSALDPDTTQAILELLKEVRRKLGITIVVITHQMEVVKRICNRIAIMEQGEIVEEGEITKVFTRPTSQTAKNFIAHSLGTTIEHKDFSKFEGTVCKLSFYGEVAHEPVLSKLTKDYGIEINVLFGNIEHLYTGIVGSLIVELRGDKERVNEALKYYETLDTRVEVIKDVTAISA